MSEAWWNLCTIYWIWKWETEGSPFSTDKSEVDSNEKQGWCDPQHQTDWDICPVEENKRWRVGLFSVIESIIISLPTFATLLSVQQYIECERGRLWQSLSAFLSAILSGFTLLSVFLSAQKSKTTQKRALESEYALLSAQKSAETSGFAQKSTLLSGFTLLSTFECFFEHISSPPK